MPPSSTARAPSSSSPPSQDLQRRLQGVLQHQQFFWWVGHVIIVISTIFHFLYWFRFNYNTKMALFWYRLAFLGAVGSYGVVVHKMFFRVSPQCPTLTKAGFREATRQEGLFYRLYLDENAEYLGMSTLESVDLFLVLALTWLFTSPVFLALVPYFIYSVFHVITYFSEYVLPAITARPARPQEDRLAQLARKYQDAGSQTVAKVEVYGILLRLLIGVIWYPQPPIPLPTTLSTILCSCHTNLVFIASTNWHSSNYQSLQYSFATNTSIQLTPAPPSANSLQTSTN